MPAACRIRTVPGLTMRPWVRGSLISIRDRRYRAFSASPTESVAEAQLNRAAATVSSKHSMKNETLPRTPRLLPRRRASALRRGPSADGPQAVEKSCWSEKLEATTRRVGQASAGDRAKTDWLWGAAQDPVARDR